MTQFFNSFETCTKYLLLLYLVRYGITVNSEILQFLNIPKSSQLNLLHLNLQNNFMIDSLINRNNFAYLVNFGLLSQIKNEMNIIFDNGANFLSKENNEEIFEIIYESQSFLKINAKSDGKNYLTVASDFNSMFKKMKKLMNDIN